MLIADCYLPALVSTGYETRIAACTTSNHISRLYQSSTSLTLSGCILTFAARMTQCVVPFHLIFSILTCGQTLRHLAIREGKKYTGSSSSLTGIMAHVYRLISGEKPVNLESFSLPYGQEVWGSHVSTVDYADALHLTAHKLHYQPNVADQGANDPARWSLVTRPGRWVERR